MKECSWSGNFIQRPSKDQELLADKSEMLQIRISNYKIIYAKKIYAILMIPIYLQMSSLKINT